MLVFMYRESDDMLGYKNMPNHTHFVQHNDEYHVGNIKLKVLHTPGHTPESISFLLTDQRCWSNKFQWDYSVVILFL